MNNVTELIRAVSSTDSTSGSTDSDFTAADVFFFILRWGTLLISIVLVLMSGYPITYLLSFDRSKGGFQDPPTGEDWKNFGFLLTMIYFIIFVIVSIAKDGFHHQSIHVYRNIGIAALVTIFATPAVMGAVIVVLWVCQKATSIASEGVTAWMIRTTKASRKRYGYVEPEADGQQTELEESPGGGDIRREDEEEDEENVALMSLVDDEPVRSKEEV